MTDEQFKENFIGLAKLSLAFSSLQYLVETMDGKAYVIRGIVDSDSDNCKIAPWRLQDEMSEDYQWEEKEYTIEEVEKLIRDDFELNTRIRNEITYISNFQKVKRAFKNLKYDVIDAESDLLFDLQFLKVDKKNAD